MTSPAISVIILTHNRPALVRRAVASVLAQRGADAELLLIDNGSDAEGAAVCEALAAENPALRLLRRDGGSIGAGRNAGLDAARGGYIAFIDDDDYAYPDMLAFLHGLAARHGADIAFCGSDKELPGADVRPNFVFDSELVLTPEDATVELLERRLLNLATPTKLFRRELFEGERFREDRKYDDISTTYRLFASANRVAGHGVPQYCFNRHGANNSGFTDRDASLSPAQLDEYFEVYRERTAWLEARLPAIAEYVRYSEWSFLLSMYRKITVNRLSACETQRRYCADRLREAGARYLRSAWIKPFEFDYLRLFKETDCGPDSPR